MFDNWIDLSCLPKENNKISWQKCNNNFVKFKYRNNTGCIKILKRISCRKLLVEFNNQEFIFDIESLKRCCLGKLFNFSVQNNYKYSIGQILVRTISKIIIEKQLRLKHNIKNSIKQSTVKGYSVKCLSCNKNFNVSEINLDRGDGCPYCSNHRVCIGLNDINTTRSDVARLFLHDDDKYKYTQFSNKKIDIKCNKCNSYLGKKKIVDITTRGLSCPYCSDGISYPNKLMFVLLKNIGEQFRREVIFDWCKFPSYNNKDIISYGRYDFVIDNKKLIIEMDGGLGHGHNTYSHSRYSKEELIYRDKRKNELAISNGYNIIRIDCDYGKNNKYEYCKKSILNSELSCIYNLKIVDWQKINQLSLESYVLHAIDLYNSGKTSSQIADLLSLDQSTIIDYLHKGNYLKMCCF